MASTFGRYSFSLEFFSLPMWVETYSVFLNEKLTTQELTKRELGQLIDLRPEWADDSSTEVTNWNCRDHPLIRLLSEIVTAGAYWLQTLDSVPKTFCIFPRNSTSLVKHFCICGRPNYTNITSRLFWMGVGTLSLTLSDWIF